MGIFCLLYTVKVCSSGFIHTSGRNRLVLGKSIQNSYKNIQKTIYAHRQTLTGTVLTYTTVYYKYIIQINSFY